VDIANTTTTDGSVNFLERLKRSRSAACLCLSRFSTLSATSFSRLSATKLFLTYAHCPVYEQVENDIAQFAVFNVSSCVNLHSTSKSAVLRINFQRRAMTGNADYAVRRLLKMTEFFGVFR